MRRILGLSALLASAAAPAFAHGGHEVSGFLPPFSGLDHLVAMVGVGLWAALLGSRRPAAMVAVPVAVDGRPRTSLTAEVATTWLAVMPMPGTCLKEPLTSKPAGSGYTAWNLICEPLPFHQFGCTLQNVLLRG